MSMMKEWYVSVVCHYFVTADTREEAEAKAYDFMLNGQNGSTFDIDVEEYTNETKVASPVYSSRKRDS